jgi:hypothetical protein
MKHLFNTLAAATGNVSGVILGKTVVGFEAAANAFENLAKGQTSAFLKTAIEATATILKQGATLSSKPFALDAAELKAEALEQKASMKNAFMNAGQKAFKQEVAKPKPKPAGMGLTT